MFLLIQRALFNFLIWLNDTAPLNREPKIIRMRATLALLLIIESSIASLTCYSFYALILYLFINQI